MTTFPAECVLRAGAVLAEGPVWDVARQRLWWVDIESRELHSYGPEARNDRAWTLADRISFGVPTARGDFIVGIGGGLARFAPDKKGAVTPIADPEKEWPANRFNDAKCDPTGRLWAGTMAVSEEPARGHLYRIDARLQVSCMAERVTVSNGLAWSPDGCAMYYIDSPTRRVDAFDFDPASGDIANRRTIVEIAEGFPDGMCTDLEGNLWVALWGGWGVACFDPRTGRQIAKIEVPVEAVTSCCFGGAECTELYITTASRDLDAAGRAAQPLAGSIFAARPSVPGAPPHLFAG